jgi:hypothetical protein
MSRRNRMIRDLVDQWTERFGEPPPIRTDPELMRSVLEDCEPRRREAECAAPLA